MYACLACVVCNVSGAGRWRAAQLAASVPARARVRRRRRVPRKSTLRHWNPARSPASSSDGLTAPRALRRRALHQVTCLASGGRARITLHARQLNGRYLFTHNYLTCVNNTVSVRKLYPVSIGVMFKFEILKTLSKT